MTQKRFRCQNVIAPGAPREKKMLKGHLPRVIPPSVPVYEDHWYDPETASLPVSNISIRFSSLA